MVPRPTLTMPQSSRRNRMLMLVFGTGLAVGLHLGLLHLVLWGSWKTVLTFFLASGVYALLTYMLWRWVFPVLGGRTFGGQLVRQGLAAVAAFTILSLAIDGTSNWLAGGVGLFGVPTGNDLQITVTPAMRQHALRLYVLLPVLPVMLMALIGYHLV